MNRRNIFVAALACAAFIPALAADNDPTTNFTFAENSPLADGRWVKISISGSGVYEISYDRLREMGFSNPENVAIYGTGGNRRNLNFLDKNGKRLMEDNVYAVPLMRVDNKIVFYGVGDRNINFVYKYEGSVKYPRFSRDDQNTWSEDSYYLLTDSKPAAEPQKAEATGKESAKLLSKGYGALYEEEDVINGFYDSGDMWYGSYLSKTEPAVFDVKMKYCVPDATCYLFADATVFRGPAGYFITEFNGLTKREEFQKGSSTINTFTNYNSGNKMTVNKYTNFGTASIKISYSGEYAQSYVMALDYWSAAIPVSFEYIDKDNTFDQFEAGFMGNNTGGWKHYAPKKAVIWDISDATRPKIADSDGEWFYTNYSTASKFVAFDPSKTMKQINDGWKEIRNTNLHALQSDDAYDMVIITVESMKKYADRIAKLHEEFDGQRVAVAVQEDIFNEFNAGTPDPTAYRLLAKMLYQHPEHKLKNVLMLGPLRADYRNIRNFDIKNEALIAYQDFYKQDIWSISYPAFDFPGVITDYTAVTSFPYVPVSLGVGYLPIESDQDGEMAVAKIRRHLEKKDFSGMVNETYSISCPGDSHIHEKQAIGIGERIQQYASNQLKSKFAHETLWTEPLNKEMTVTRITEAMRRGKSLIVYFGHATHEQLNPGFTIHDSMNAGNEEMGVAFWGGCDLTKIDWGLHGMGDLGVIRSDNGFIGIVAATRTVMSNHNETLGRNMVTSWFQNRDNTPRTVTPTIGEVYANAKDRTTNQSSLCYLYVGDPALRVPLALSKVKIEEFDRKLFPGEIVNVKGSVLSSDDNVNENYNGFVTLKLMEPARMVVTEGTDANQKMPDYEINDLPILTVKGQVKNGKFDVKLVVPEDAEQYMATDGENVMLPLLAGTWDGNPDMPLGGSGIIDLPIALDGTQPDIELPKDEKAPMITVAYDPELELVTVNAIDDVALLPGVGPGCGISLTINGTDAIVESGELDGVSVNSFTGTVDVSSLGFGKHKALAYATDIAGNVSESKALNFEIAASGSMPKIAIKESIAIDEVSITLTGTDSTLQLVITDRDGNVVKTTTADKGENTIDISTLPAGSYKAFTRSDSSKGAKSYSNTVEFTVID